MKIIADFSHCVRSFWKNSTCDKCVKACPAGALYVSNGRIEAAPELCAGCGLCIPACPTGVFKLDGELGPEVSCRTAGVCIGALRLEDLESLVEKYGEVMLDARCDDCKFKDRAYEVVQKAKDAGLRVKVLEGRGGDVSKRFLLRRGVGALAGERALEVRRGLPRRVKPRRGSGAAPSIDVNKCTLCGVCAGVCPTEAISVDEESGLVVVHPENCVACGVCVEACDVGAIRLVEKAVDTHFLVEVVQCLNCGTVYAKNRGECPVCGFTTRLIREVYGL